jgi:endonuclease YncB( thermonuclease family)
MGNLITKCILSRRTNTNTNKFRFDGQTKYCKVLDVYDGDTITVGIILDTKPYRVKVRLLGYDSPEIKPRLNIVNREEEIHKAVEAREVLKSIILNKIAKLKISIKSWDKYGRLLATLYIQSNNENNILSDDYNINVNKYMIDNGYGKIYNGGKKM